MIDRDELDMDVAALLSKNFPVPLRIIEIKEMLQMNGWSGSGLRTRHVIASCRRLSRAGRASPSRQPRHLSSQNLVSGTGRSEMRFRTAAAAFDENEKETK